MIKVINHETGEVRHYSGELMVASNGVMFIKHKGKTVFASGSTDITCMVEDSGE